MSELPAHTIGSGNVFADIGVSDPELALAKAKLVRHIDACILARKLTQKQAAELLGIDQADLSRLLRGRTRGFSLDRLIRMLTQLDLDVDINVRPSHRGQRSQPGGRLVVHEAEPMTGAMAATPTRRDGAVRFD